MPREYRIVVSGTVQGVFFRAKTKEHADYLGIKGTVRNLSNGDVEIRVAGTKEEADRLVAAMQAEPFPIQINSVKIVASNADEIHSGFRVVQ